MEIGYFADTTDTLEGRCLLNEGCNLLIQLRDAEYLCCTLSQLLEFSIRRVRHSYLLYSGQKPQKRYLRYLAFNIFLPVLLSPRYDGI